MGIIEEYRSQVGENIPNNDSSQIETDIDVFKEDNDKDGIIDAVESISTYWNDSVKKLLEAFNDFFSANGLNTIKDNAPYDAGRSFENEPYVHPWKNNDNESYTEVRTYEIKSVLENEEKLDFTRSQIEGCITRLLMPQYARRIEIEDLNRNFWVISQNLEALNKFISELSLDWADELIAELMGIWNNIYKLWEALIAIEEKYNNISSNEKIRIIFDYGFGIYNSYNYAAILATPESYSGLKDGRPYGHTIGRSYNLGVLPYIRKTGIKPHESFDSEGNYYVHHVHYNEYLNSLLKLNDEEYKNIEDIKGRGLVRLASEYQDTKRDLVRIVKTLEQKNFCLVDVSKTDAHLSYALTTPLKNALDFYRRYLYWIDNADDGTESPIAAYFEDKNKDEGKGYVDAGTTFGDSTLNDDAEWSQKITWDLVDNYIHLGQHCYSSTCSSTTCGVANTGAAPLKLKLTDEINDEIKRNFRFLQYYLKSISGSKYDDCPFIEGVLNTSVDTVEKLRTVFSNVNGVTNFTASMPTLIYNYVGIINLLKDEELEANGILYVLNNGGFNWNIHVYVNDKLLNESFNDTSNNLGLYYYKQFDHTIHEDHIWIDFVNDASDYYVKSNSKIRSITCNEKFYEDKPTKYLYDWNISVPITKNIPVPYENFVRLSKPLPCLYYVYYDKIRGDDYESTYYDNLNTLNHYIGVDSSASNTYCIDGFMLTKEEYEKLTKDLYLEPLNDTILDNKTLLYNVSTSDMISYEHEEDGQSKLSNSHDFINPVVNLRCINGRTKNQEVEIITTKDSTIVQEKIPPEDITPQEMSFKEIKLYTLGEDSEKAISVDVQAKDANGAYTKGLLVRKEGEQLGSILVSEKTNNENDYTFENNDQRAYYTYFHQEEGDCYALRQKLPLDKEVQGGFRFLSVATSTDALTNRIIGARQDGATNDQKELVEYINYIFKGTGTTTTEAAKNYIKTKCDADNTLDTEWRGYLITQDIINSSSSYGRAVQHAGIYLSYLYIRNSEGTVYHFIPIHRIVSPGLICKVCSIKDKTSASVIFAQKLGMYYGHAGKDDDDDDNTSWYIKHESTLASGKYYPSEKIIKGNIKIQLIGNKNISTDNHIYAEIQIEFNSAIIEPNIYINWIEGDHNPMNGSTNIALYAE